MIYCNGFAVTWHEPGVNYNSSNRCSWILALCGHCDQVVWLDLLCFCNRSRMRNYLNQGTLTLFWRGKYQYGWPPCPYWLGISCFKTSWEFFFHFQNNLVLTGKYKEVNRTDTSPLNKVSVPWFNSLVVLRSLVLVSIQWPFWKSTINVKDKILWNWCLFWTTKDWWAPVAAQR